MKYYIAFMWTVGCSHIQVEFYAKDDENAKEEAEELLLREVRKDKHREIHTPGNSLPNGGIYAIFEDTSKRFVG